MYGINYQRSVYRLVVLICSRIVEAVYRSNKHRFNVE